MSVKATGRVWELDLPHAERLVLLALADHADHVGDNIYPSIGLIAWKTGYSDRQVQRIIARLVDSNILRVVAKHAGRTAVYRMDLEAGTVKPPYVRQNVRGDKMSGVDTTSPPVKMSPHPRHSYVTPTPDIAMSPEPSLEPSINRGGKPAPDPTLKHPAVVAYREFWSLTPGQPQRVEIAQQVTDLERWNETMKRWQLSGHKPGNVLGQLDWYNGAGPRQNGRAAGKRLEHATDAELLAHFHGG